MKWTNVIFFAVLLFTIGCDAPSNVANNNDNKTTANADADTEHPTVPSVAEGKKDFKVAFYNVENLFDIVDNPDKPDDEFTPTGANKWTAERYNDKLTKIGKVIAAMGLPTFVGMCEMENEAVLKDLVANPQLADGHYGVAHRESNDYRGIDLALLYDKEQFVVENIDNIVLNFPKSITGGQNYTSRDLFHVTGEMRDKTVLHIFVNHFPSRRGGTRESEPKRTFVAGELRKEIDKVLAADENAHIIIMGDFNDKPEDKSIAKVLKAVEKDTDEPQELINCFTSFHKEGKGSYNYRGNWDMLDQIILSDNFFNATATWKYKAATIFSKDWMMYKDKDGNESPNRTYGGPNYYGGFSDHLPVYVEIAK